MLRVAFLVLAVVVLIALLRGGLRRKRPAPPPTAAPPAVGEPQEMVACAHCGVHLPRSEAVVAPSGTFCGEAHRLQHEQRADADR